MIAENSPSEESEISAGTVKELVSNTHPNAPEGKLQKVKLENSLPGSKGYK